MCLYPRLIKNRKYTENKKNGGNIPAVIDVRTLYVPIGCGNCMECRKQKQREWQVRLMEDIKQHTNGKFITLTFSDESIRKLCIHLRDKAEDPFNIVSGYDLDNAIATAAMRLFLERWRKEYKKSLRHWFVSELGHNGTENIHLHGIIWTDEHLDKVEKHWKYGFIWKGKRIKGNKTQPDRIINYVNEQTVNYCIKYVSKMDVIHKTYKPIILCSPGIGKNYTTGYNYKLNKFNGKDTIETYRTRTGHKISMPIYWRNKIYSDQEKEQLWINRLNKQERWVLGNRIDISQSETEYFKALREAQRTNKELGYGEDKLNWSRRKYEQERRILIQQTRINRAYNNNK